MKNVYQLRLMPELVYIKYISMYVCVRVCVTTMWGAKIGSTRLHLMAGLVFFGFDKNL